jgi:hypothetical protein
MSVVKKPEINAINIDNVIKKGGSTTSEQSIREIFNVSLKLSPQLNSAIESLQKNQFGIKRTKKQWITEAILAKIKKESGKEYQEA